MTETKIETVDIPTFTIHVKKWEFNPKLDLRNKDASVNIELSHIKAKKLIQDIEREMKLTHGAIRVKISGTRGDF